MNVGGAINNAVTLSKYGEQVRLLVCNNDETIKIFSLPTLDQVCNIKLPTAANYASVSPDGRWMVAVGDSNQVFLYEVTVHGQYRLVQQLTSVKDASFNVSWNSLSTQFAVACQDGWVCVWDLRSPHKLAQIPSQQGAVRAVKFSQSGSIDLLAFTEHQTSIGIVDARTFDRPEYARICSHGESNLGGLAFRPDGRSLVYGTEQGLVEFDIKVKGRQLLPYAAPL